MKFETGASPQRFNDHFRVPITGHLLRLFDQYFHRPDPFSCRPTKSVIEVFISLHDETQRNTTTVFIFLCVTTNQYQKHLQSKTVTSIMKKCSFGHWNRKKIKKQIIGKVK